MWHLIEDFFEQSLVMKAFIGWVTKGLHKGHALRREIYAVKALPDVYGILDAHFETAASEKLMGESATHIVG